MGSSQQPVGNYAIKMMNVYKTFNNGQIVANDGINLFVKLNEIHAVIGENGAGKTTLMSIIMGLYKPDGGEIYIHGKRVHFTSAKDATKVGIGMIHQHFALVEDYTVLDNIILGAEITNFGFLNRHDAILFLNDIMEKYNIHINLKARVNSLSVAQQQKVEILKILYRRLSILIFDEPTASLSKLEIDSFLNMLKVFKSMGHTIVLISHKLGEIKRVADNATIIRRGKLVKSVTVSETSTDELATLMVGANVVTVRNTLTDDWVNNKVVLDVKNLDLNKKNLFFNFFLLILILLRRFARKVFRLKNAKPLVLKQNEKKDRNLINFNVRQGEIFAIAGVEGNGQKELIDKITGASKVDDGAVLINGNNVSKMNIGKHRKNGMAYVPEDRHKLGLTLDDTCRMNVVDNVISQPPFSAFGFIRKNQIAFHADKLIKKYDIRGTIHGTAYVRSLSGGNQQKIIIARELYVGHDLLILVQCTRGLDVGAMEYVHQQIMEEKKLGKAILLISYELDEIFALADTISVMSKNRLLGIYPRDEITYEKIGKLMGGERYE